MSESEVRTAIINMANALDNSNEDIITLWQSVTNASERINDAMTELNHIMRVQQDKGNGLARDVSILEQHIAERALKYRKLRRRLARMENEHRAIESQWETRNYDLQIENAALLKRLEALESAAE